MRLLLPALLLLSCGPRFTPASRGALESIVAAADRSEADKALDPGRKPVEFLAFTTVGEGMRVAELMAGTGYTTELLSRVVGPRGVVYGENPKVVLERFAEQGWAARLSKLSNVLRVDRELDDPLPPEARGTLDVVVSNAIYHDTTWLETDRLAMNRAVFRALKYGGRYVVCDSSAAEGRGIEDAKTLHRIEERVVREEATLAGFVLDGVGDFLRNPSDARDWNVSPGAAAERRGTGDRFCLRFLRPVVVY